MSYEPRQNDLPTIISTIKIPTKPFITSDLDKVATEDRAGFTTYQELGALDEIDYRFKEVIKSLNNFLKKHPNLKASSYSIFNQIEIYLKTTKLQQQNFDSPFFTKSKNFDKLREMQLRKLADSIQILFLLADE